MVSCINWYPIMANTVLVMLLLNYLCFFCKVCQSEQFSGYSLHFWPNRRTILPVWLGSKVVHLYKLTAQSLSHTYIHTTSENEMYTYAQTHCSVFIYRLWQGAIAKKKDNWMEEQGVSRSCIRYFAQARQVLYNWLKLQRVYKKTANFCSFIVVCWLYTK